MEVSPETLYDSAERLFQFSKKRLAADLESTLDCIWEAALNRFYYQFPIDVSLNIIVKWIEPNDPINYGRGDLSHAIKTANLFQEAFPNAHVYLINAFKKGTARVSYQSKKAEIVELPSHSRRTEFIIGLLSPEILLDAICEWYPDVPCVMFDVASPKVSLWPFSHDHLEGKKEPRLLSCVHIDEYNGQRTLKRGFVRSGMNHMWVSCGIGLDQKGFPTIGIHLKPEMAYQSHDFSTMIETLEDKDLAFELNSGSLYADTTFYFSYTSAQDTIQWARFVHLVLAYEDRLDGEHGVNLLLLTSVEKTQKILSHWKSALQLSWKKSSFREVQLSYSRDGERIWEDLVLNREGKRYIRVIEWTKRVPHQDMINLMKGSGTVLQVTGDQSWAEAVSLRNRVIFYQIMPWKQDLLGEMAAIAEHLYGEGSSLAQFLGYTNEKHSQSDIGKTWMSEHIGELLHSGDLVEKHCGFVDCLHSEYGIRPWLFGFVKRLASHEKDCDLERREELAYDNWAYKQKPHLYGKVLAHHLQKLAGVTYAETENKRCGMIGVEVSSTRRIFFDSVKEMFNQHIPLNEDAG